MEVVVFAWWSALLLGAIPLLLQAVWYWNDVVFSASLWLRRARGDKESVTLPKLPPGHMGLPFIGETLTFLWYFKILRRPDDFIKSKKQKYGEGVGMYRSHIFGYPSIITCSPESNKFVLQSASDFHIRWPAPELFGLASLTNVEGKKHTRVKSYVVNAINHPRALRRVAQIVQPRIVSSLCSWASKGNINGLLESKKMTFENICMMFASMDPGPLLDEIDKCFAGLAPGFRAYPLDFPGTAFHHARRCRWRLNAVFREELEKKKQQQKESSPGEIGDLMDGLMQIKDEEGKQLTDDEVVDNIVSFVIAGYSSTSYALMWALYHLSNSPEVLRKLREENVSPEVRSKGGVNQRRRRVCLQGPRSAL